MQYSFRYCCFPEESRRHMNRKARGEQVSSEIHVFLCREALIWTCLGIVSEVHSGLASPLLTECQLGRDLNGLKWSFQLRCVLQRRRHGVGRETDWETDRQAGRNRRKDRHEETKQQGCELIYRFTCVHEWVSVPPAGPHAAFRPQHDWLIWLIYWLQKAVRTNRLWKIKIS